MKKVILIVLAGLLLLIAIAVRSASQDRKPAPIINAYATNISASDRLKVYTPTELYSMNVPNGTKLKLVGYLTGFSHDSEDWRIIGVGQMADGYLGGVLCDVTMDDFLYASYHYRLGDPIVVTGAYIKGNGFFLLRSCAVDRSQKN